MSGIEKVCEYSGLNPGYRMYEYKRNSLQILPEFRKLFRGKEFKFFRFLDNYDLTSNDKPMTDYCLNVPEIEGQVHGFYYNWTFGQWGIVKRKLKRLLGCRKLKVIPIPLTMTEFYEYCNMPGFGLKLDFNKTLLESESYTENDWLDIIRVFDLNYEWDLK